MTLEKNLPVKLAASVPKHVTGERDVFCNRELSMKQIKAVGFDMDYTLAQYFPAFDLLAFEGAKEKLVHKLGYPSQVLEFDYDPNYFTRGLVIDKQRGNIIKMDRHKYVRVAYHGFQKMSSEERKSMYHASFSLTPSFAGSNFVNMDTLFSLVDCVLFAHLVDLKDKHPDLLPQPYEKLFSDVRQCVDLCHRDGVIKDRVAEDPARYIMPDTQLLPMLRRLKAEGIQTFLLTNSLWDYTAVVMSFLYEQGGGGSEPGERDDPQGWMDLFDLIIVGACKPGFLLDPFLSLFRVNTAENTLTNTDGVLGEPEAFLAQGKVFQGGNWQHLHELLRLSSGDQLLYVGDHMFSDILRSKRTLGWRTCLIVPELENEIATHNRHSELRDFINELRALQYDLDEWADLLRDQVRHRGEGDEEGLEHLQMELSLLVADQRKLKEILRQEGLKFHHLFHPAWGQLFKSGYQDSRFAQQVSIYACLYTSRASNLSFMSAQRSFRPVRDLAAHDQLLESGDRLISLEQLRNKLLMGHPGDYQS
ncbi:5'-nucleotidase [Tribonema minus]|uniref:5'-nucleotidase n=1 Tax=Tribonema minus TaxID=303371 RepID=A0A835Z4H4_9STRA|nr:5'-nucleotidase [Tribonema minus]